MSDPTTSFYKVLLFAPLLLLFFPADISAAVRVIPESEAIFSPSISPKKAKKANRKLARAEKKRKPRALLSFLSGLLAVGLLVPLVPGLFFAAVPLGLLAILFGIRSSRREGKSLLGSLGILFGGIATILGLIFLIGVFMG